MSELQGKFRRRKTNFAAVSNAALRDSSLSLKAKGLYAVIQSYINIPDYDLYKGYLMKNCREGERAFNAAWKELKDQGYLKLYRMPGQKRGQFIYEYELLDIANQSTPSTINLNSKGEQTVQKKGSQPHSEKQQCKDKNTEDVPLDHTLQNVPYGQNGQNHDHALHFAPYAKSTICSEHPMLRAPGAKRGYLNNKETNKIETNKKNGNNNLSVSQSIEDQDGQTDFLREKLKKQIDYDYFEDNFPNNLSGVNVLLDCMVRMLKSTTTCIGGYSQSRETLRPYIAKVDSEVVRGFLEHMRGKSMKGIRNVNGYWQSALIDYVRSRELTLLTAN